MNPPQFFALVIVLGLPFAALIARMTFRHAERMAELKGGDGKGDQTIHSRLDRIEQSVEAIAVEVERIGEGQRFLTRLANERPVPAVESPRGITGRP